MMVLEMVTFGAGPLGVFVGVGPPGVGVGVFVGGLPADDPLEGAAAPTLIIRAMTSKTVNHVLRLRKLFMASSLR